MTPREQRGLVIAQKCEIVKSGNLWKVPAQSHDGIYSVKVEGRMYCSCPDFAERYGAGDDEPCKHVFAVKFSLTKRVVLADGTKIKTTVEVERVVKPTYRQNWKQYNAAQTNEHKHFNAFLSDMCGTIPAVEGKRGRGRPALSPSDAAFCAISKVYGMMSARRANGDLEEAAGLGYISRVPHFNSVLNFFDSPDATPILQNFVALSASPLVGLETKFAVDSTGFAGASYFRWLDERHGVERKEIKWLKLHAIIGVRTNAVIACKVMDKDSADSPQLGELVAEAAKSFTIAEVSADKAYSSLGNFELVESFGAAFYPKFKRNATGGVGGAFAKAFHLMQANLEAYDAKYHLRSNVESTFSGIKRLMGESLRSKNELAMTNETLAKVVCYNLTRTIHAMYECGIDPEFIIKPRCTSNPEAAQINA